MDYKMIANEIIEELQAQGADGEVYLEEGTDSRVEVLNGKVEKLSSANSKGIGIRAISAGRMGYAFTSDFSSESIEKTWRGALELSRVTDADEYRALPDPMQIEDEDLEIFDPAIQGLAMEDKIAFALEVERATLEYDPRIVMSQRCTYLDGVASVHLFNSRGFEGSYQKSFAASYIMAIAKDDSDTSKAYGLGASTFLSDIDAKEIGQEASMNAIRLLGGKPVPTQEASVVLDPVVAGELIFYLSTALTGEAMQRGRSFLQGKVGKSVASDMVILLDNGRLKRGLGTAPFDGEGVPTRATRMIDEGILQAVVYDTYTAKKDGKQSTGNASRGSHRSIPALAASNVYLQPGNRSQEDIIAGVEKGLYVLDTMNVGGINPVSGDYSVAASGIWIENGRLTFPVNNVTLAIPLGDLLTQVKAVGNDLRFLPFYGAVGAPTILVEHVMIGGSEEPATG